MPLAPSTAWADPPTGGQACLPEGRYLLVTYISVYSFNPEPIHVAPSGTSLVTTLPAPILHHEPMFTRGRINALAPIIVPSPTEISPHKVAWGARCTKSPSRQSWSTEAPVLTITCLPTLQLTLTMAPSMITLPSSISERLETIAEG